MTVWGINEPVCNLWLWKRLHYDHLTPSIVLHNTLIPSLERWHQNINTDLQDTANNMALSIPSSVSLLRSQAWEAEEVHWEVLHNKAIFLWDEQTGLSAFCCHLSGSAHTYMAGLVIWKCHFIHTELPVNFTLSHPQTQCDMQCEAHCDFIVLFHPMS